MAQAMISGSDTVKPLLSLEQASELLDVSTATLNNWVRAGQIQPVSSHKGGKKYFNSAEVLKLIQELAVGGVNRLNSRANKRNSAITFIPVEQLRDKSLVLVVQKYLDLIHKSGLSMEQALCAYSLYLLQQAGLIKFGKATLTLEDVDCRNANIKAVLKEWEALCGKVDLSKFTKLIAAGADWGNDGLGILYQSLLNEGSKAQGGTYYTPRKIIDSIVQKFAGQLKTAADSKVLDPCCGTGAFLQAFSGVVADPERLWGYDIDPVAVQIAKINMLLNYPGKDFYPRIFLADTLLSNPDGQFDIIATNPPWGYHFSATQTAKLKKLYSSVKSNEAFSYFIVRGLSLLRSGGDLCFVLPESILKVKQHQDIREFLLKQSSIVNITHFGKAFKKVLSPVISLHIRKGAGTDNVVEVVSEKCTLLNVDQKRFLNNANYVFDTRINARDEALIRKIYAQPHTTLEDQADWALGIVTGNNKKFISTEQRDGAEPVIKGSDLQRFKYKQPAAYIIFQPERFQQTAPESMYRAKEKLIYKFISKDLVFTYDNKGTMTINSANILIPKLPGIPVKVVLGFLNSELFRYLYRKQFDTIKVLRGDLEKLPFPKVSAAEIAKIEGLVDRLILDNQDRQAETELNARICKLFQHNAPEIKHIRKTAGVRADDFKEALRGVYAE